MTNDELHDAISFAFQCVSQSYIGGYTTSETNAGKCMLQHLKDMLAVQLDRAKNTNK